MLEIRQLYKSYGKYTALNGLNLSIEKGELFGFVGPNGAGKTTTMRIISGLLQPDKGEVLVDGISIHKNINKIKDKIGYMPDFFGVYDNLTVREYMEFYASICGMRSGQARKMIDDLLNLVNLENHASNYVDSLSRGMKQRLCLARCLIHDPELLILDEPASGLDPMARVEVKEILKELNHRGKTIIISSHILSELSQMCSTIGIIQKGNMVLKGTVSDILKQMNTANPIKIHVLDGQERMLPLLKQNPLVENIAIKGNEYSVGFQGGKEDEAYLLLTLIENHIKVASFNRQEGNLENLFIQLTREG